MIKARKVVRHVEITDPLPPLWIRRAPTLPDSEDRAGDRVFRVGPQGELRRGLLSTIQSARDVLLASSFLFTDEDIAEELVGAARRGVRVYVLTASETQLEKLVDDDDGFDARMIAQHKAVLDRLAEVVVLRSARHFHAKLLVADPSTVGQGWISTANFNLALQESVELGVRLDAGEVRALAAWFSRAFWLESEHELQGPGRLAKVKAAPGEPRRQESSTIAVTTGTDNSLRDAVLELVASARERLVVACYGLDLDHASVEAILDRARAGVSVTVLTRPRPAIAATVEALTAAGARVLSHDKLHAKAILADARGLIMTANLEAQGLDAGFEVGVRLEDGRVTGLRRTLESWIEAFPWQLHIEASRADHEGEVCLPEQALRKGKRQLRDTREIELEAVTAESALDLDSAPDPELPIPQDGADFYRQIEYRWEVRPPKLPKKAKEELQRVKKAKTDKEGNERMVKRRVPYDPPVYSHKGRKYVLLQSPEEADAAQRQALNQGATVVVR